MNQLIHLLLPLLVPLSKMNLGTCRVCQLKISKLIIENKFGIFNLISNRFIQRIPSTKKTTIGIRAEHIYPANEARCNTYYLEVASVEQLGNETMIVFEEIGNQLWNAKWPGQWIINPGDKVPVIISVENFCFFDAENGQLIQPAYKGQRARGCCSMKTEVAMQFEQNCDSI